MDMDFDFFKRITKDMRDCGVEEIGLFYLGESFMSPELLIKCTEWVKKNLKFPWVFLTSNGINARAEYIDKVFAAGLDSLKWSVNYNGFDAFHEITGGSKWQFDNILENIYDAFNIRHVKKYDVLISASSILYDDNTKAINRQFLEDNVLPYVDKHYWLPLYQMSMYRDKIEKELGYTPTAGNMGRIDEKTMKPNRDSLPCWSAFTEGHVRVDGNLSACCFGADARFDMGKLDGTNFMKQWNSKRFLKLRAAQLKTTVNGSSALKGTPCAVCVAYDNPEEPVNWFNTLTA